MKMLVTSGIVLLCAAASAAPAFAKDTEKVDRTVPIGANGKLTLKNFSGRVTITGTNRADVSIHAVRNADRDRLDHIRLEIIQTSSGVAIEANKKDDSWRDRDNNVLETDFDIEVPADVSLDVTVFSSNVEVKDVRGSERIKTFSGEVHLDGAWSSVNAETFSGDIIVRLANASRGPVDLASFSGSLTATHDAAALEQPPPLHGRRRFGHQ
jgi:DUF4097 and DUF4098 domain-containing protein YvlB